MKVDFVLMSYNNLYYNNQQKHLDQKNLKNLVCKLIHNLWRLEMTDRAHDTYLSKEKKKRNF